MLFIIKFILKITNFIIIVKYMTSTYEKNKNKKTLSVSSSLICLGIYLFLQCTGTIIEKLT